MGKIGRNDPCPCGSGRKYKQCCLRKKNSRVASTYSSADRDSALRRLLAFAEREFSEDARDAMYTLLDGVPEGCELDEYTAMKIDEVFDGWFLFDRPLDDGRTPAERMLAEGKLTRGQRTYIESMLTSSMRLREVVDVIPGRSIELRDVLDGSTVTVREKTASMSLNKGELVAARVNPSGVSGGPELDSGLLNYSLLMQRSLAKQLNELWSDFSGQPHGQSRRSFDVMAPPFFLDAWLYNQFKPVMPEIRNGDGELILPTSTWFELNGDAAELEATLAEAPDCEPSGEGRWTWHDNDDDQGRRVLGEVILSGDEVLLETLTVERGVRGRAWLEVAAGDLLTHSVTTRTSLQERLRERAGKQRPGASQRDDSVDPDVAEAAVLQWQERHYRTWPDHPLPALDGMTPREAAEDPALQPRVAELIRGIEGLYQSALRDGEPAYDPSWMWSDLGLEEDSEDGAPPPLATGRWADAFDWEDALEDIASAFRERPDVDTTATTIGDAEIERDLSAQRLLRRLLEDTEPAIDLQVALRCALNQTLHRHKTFWVAESLAYMLSKTDNDVVGRDLQLPFPSFALVFTDRHTLSLGERLLARADEPTRLRGYLLRVLTVFVREREGAAAKDTRDTPQDSQKTSRDIPPDERSAATKNTRTIELALAFDTLGDDLPEVVMDAITVEDDERFVADPEPVPRVEFEETSGDDAPTIATRPLPALRRLIVNAILYATSAGVEPEIRPMATSTATTRRSTRPDDDTSRHPGEVFYLPGRITISEARDYQTLERGRGGGKLMHRFMVRGHWRRPNPSWKDQRMRWIAPYWKGPDLATVIERQYELTDETDARGAADE